MKKPARTWTQLVALGAPLLIVGVAAMMISFATLIDVAKINGLPFPTMFPILIDVGMVQAMIVASQFKMRGIKGTWLAYLTFAVLSIVSIGANSTHALTTADMTVTAPIWAALVAATPPATLLATTHLVMMLIPDAKERQRLQNIREKQQPVELARPVQPSIEKTSTVAPKQGEDRVAQAEPVVKPSLALVPDEAGLSEEEVLQKVKTHLREEGVRPTGKQVGEWLGKSVKTGQRFMQKLEQSGELEEMETALVAVV